MQRDSFTGTIIVALVLCVVCSVVVSSAAVLLRPFQDNNKQLDRQRNVLLAAGKFFEEQDINVAELSAAEIEEIFSDETKVKQAFINLDTGEPVDTEATGISADGYDPKKAAKSPELSEIVDAKGGPTMGISRREKYTFVYQIMSDGKVALHVLPIYGKGLWSTLYGFLALDSDTRTVRGITFYEHKETPGLGGEVDNPAWKALWPGKVVVNEQGEVDFEVIKGQVNTDAPDASHKVDGLSGATITSRGVSNMVQYWIGSDGFGPYLEKYR